MNINTRFSVGVHILTLLACKPNRGITSEMLARSVNTNSVVIRRLTGQLKKAGLVFETKYKNFVYYELNISVFEEVMLWLSQFHGGIDDENQE